MVKAGLPQQHTDQKINGLVVWLCGLSGAGKTTVAALLKEKILRQGLLVITLDGDTLREGLNKDLGFSDAGRFENIRRAAELAKFLSDNHFIVICSFITPMQKYRNVAAQILEDRYYEVFLDCPIEICIERDVKGHYLDARKKLISNFTGISAPFEVSNTAKITIRTDLELPDKTATKIFDEIAPLF